MPALPKALPRLAHKPNAVFRLKRMFDSLWPRLASAHGACLPLRRPANLVMAASAQPARFAVCRVSPSPKACVSLTLRPCRPVACAGRALDTRALKRRSRALRTRSTRCLRRAPGQTPTRRCAGHAKARARSPGSWRRGKCAFPTINRPRPQAKRLQPPGQSQDRGGRRPSRQRRAIPPHQHASQISAARRPAGDQRRHQEERIARQREPIRMASTKSRATGAA